MRAKKIISPSNTLWAEIVREHRKHRWRFPHFHPWIFRHLPIVPLHECKSLPGFWLRRGKVRPRCFRCCAHLKRRERRRGKKVQAHPLPPLWFCNLSKFRLLTGLSQGAHTHTPDTQTHCKSQSTRHVFGTAQKTGKPTVSGSSHPGECHSFWNRDKESELKVTRTFKCQRLEADARRALNSLWSPSGQRSGVTSICRVQFSISPVGDRLGSVLWAHQHHNLWQPHTSNSSNNVKWLIPLMKVYL